MTAQDIRFALRVLGKSPGFTAIAILTLALGIGANTAVFSVINAVLLEPLPYQDVDRLMVINERDETLNQIEPYSLSYVNFQNWRNVQHSFSELALFRRRILYRIAGRERTFITARMVSGNFLSVLGVNPVIGRGFTPDDDRPSATPTVILSYSGWQKLYGPQRVGGVFVADATLVLGQELQFNGSTYSVIGVLPREFTFYTSDTNQNADAYIPIGLAREPWTTDSGRPAMISALGHLKPDVPHDVARAELDGIFSNFAASTIGNEHRGAAVDPVFESVVGQDLRTTLRLFAFAVGIVLLIACANVANLLLARGTTRQKEIAIRSALGGSRRRIAGQLIIESVVLAMAGGATGLLAAIAATDLLAVSARTLPRVDTIGIDWRVLFFASGISVLTGVAFGAAPTLQALRANIQAELRESGTGFIAARQTIQKALIVGETALALVLLLAAGLVLRSTQKALSVDPGFDPKGVWICSVVISPGEYSTVAETRNFFRLLETRITTMPEVQAVSIGLGGIPKPVAVEPDFLRLMGISLLKGRFFDARDTQTSSAVIVIDERLARARFGDRDAIGQSFVIDLPGARAVSLDRAREVIGVVRHIEMLGLETSDETQMWLPLGFYLSADQVPGLFETPLSGILIKSTLAENKIRNQLEAAVHAVNPNIEVTGLLKMQDAIEIALVSRRFVTNLLGLFALIAFVLAALGIFGLMAHSVSQRTHEFGVRLALGADSGRLIKMVLKQAAAIAGAGIGLGLLCSFGLTRVIGHLLFNITALDPVTYATAVTLLFSTTLAAAYVPALRATQLEPMAALREMEKWSGRPTTPFGVPQKSGNKAMTPFSPNPAIEVRNLQKTYTTFRKKAPALSGVSFEVEPGTIFGLIGQNGAGKTTLVKILLGLSKPTAGSARVLGCTPGSPIANRRIGYLPEQMGIPEHFVADNFLRYMGKLNKVDSVTLNARIPELLEKVGLGGVRKPVKAYSKGMQQRLGLAQALVNDPEILILDEPTDGLDPLGRIFVRDLLIEMKAAGKTIFLNSHLLSEVELVCDRIVILDKGLVACTTAPAEFTHGTGEYIMRIGSLDETAAETARRVAASVIGLAAWQDGAIRFKARDTGQLNELIDALRRGQVPILSLEPIKLSLEQFFIQVISEKES